MRSALHPYHDAQPDPAKSVFLCGAPRSGTTWLAERLNHANDYRYVYEPFNFENVPMCRHFLARQYLGPDDDNAAYLDPATAIFSGRIRNAWVDQYNRCPNVQRRLIKDVRSTLMLKWIRNHFPQMPIVFLLRQPCAVAVSRLKLGYPTDLMETVFSRQPALMADYLAPMARAIGLAQTPFQRHVADWCIENAVPLTQLVEGDVHLVFYENLVMNPEQELRRLFHFLGRPFEESILDGLRTPSATSRPGGQGRVAPTDRRSIEGWHRHVSADERSAARRLTTAFGLDEIYGAASLPSARGAQALSGARARA